MRSRFPCFAIRVSNLGIYARNAPTNSPSDSVRFPASHAIDNCGKPKLDRMAWRRSGSVPNDLFGLQSAFRIALTCAATSRRLQLVQHFGVSRSRP